MNQTSPSTELILRYFPETGSQQLEQFAALKSLYEEWNAQINVISRKDIEQLYERHVLHSLAIFKFVQFKPGSRILDIGTGGGFPGIPLAIMHPESHFVLVDSIGKKIKVVQEIAIALGLKNVDAKHDRAENVKGSFDFVVSRAVADMSILLSWCQGKFSKKQINAIPNGLICLKGGDLTTELKGLPKNIQQFQLTSWFEGEFFETKKLIYAPFQ